LNPRLDTIVAAIHAATPPDKMTTKLVGIDGCGGSGKTTLATQLAAQISAPVIHTDDFAQWDNALDWSPRFMEQVIIPFQNNEPARYQRYDWTTKTLTEWHEVPTGGIVIIEGVSATRALFRPVLSYTIYVDAPRELRLKRGLARDGAAARPLWDQWQAEEDAYLASENPASKADVVIDGTVPVA